jgi:hypothetical protein
MVCCVREAATGEYPIGRGQPNRKVNLINKYLFFRLNFLFQVNNERTKAKRR